MLLTHLHDKAFFMGAPRLRRQLILQAAALLIQLHHRVLAIFGQDRTLTALSMTRGQWLLNTQNCTAFYSRVFFSPSETALQLILASTIKGTRENSGTYIFWWRRRGSSLYWFLVSSSVTSGLGFWLWACRKTEILQDLWMTKAKMLTGRKIKQQSIFLHSWTSWVAIAMKKCKCFT